MTDYLTLIEFVPGTKAKAQDVNANFSAIKDSLETKALLEGDETQTFKVADATFDSHAVNKSQLDELSDDLTSQINKTGTRFCVKSGNVTDGKGDLFSYSGMVITPKIGGTYADLVIADYKGEISTISATTPSTLNLTGNSNGIYNIFISSTGGLYILNDKIYRRPSRPTMVVNDVWLNTSGDPFGCIKYNGTTDVEFLDVPLGKVTISGGTITSIETFQFNQNGHNVNAQTIGYRFPDYANGVSRLINTTYTAEIDGWLLCESKIQSYLSEGYVYCTINSIPMTINSCGGDNADFSSNLAAIPVVKGDVYTFTTSGGSLNAFNAKFYSVKGVN